jgi:hypothetical protein
MNIPAHDWTPEAKELVAALYIEGKSATEISQAVRERFALIKTRNAVIGVISRLGLSRGLKSPRKGIEPPRARPSAPRRVTPPRERSAPPMPPPETVAIALPPRGRSHVPQIVCIGHPPSCDPASARSKRLTELSLRDCRYPVGVATGADQLFCADHAPEDDPYCPLHRRIAGGKRTKIKGAIKLPRYAR